MYIENSDFGLPEDGHGPYLDSYAENITWVVDVLEAMATELSYVDDVHAASFFMEVSQAINAFAAVRLSMSWRQLDRTDL